MTDTANINAVPLILQALTDALSVEAFAKRLPVGFSVRVTEEDGESLFGTCDWQPNRVNVSVTQGKVIGFLGMG